MHPLHQQLTALITDESNRIANLSNTCALLNDYLTQINWIGFYLWNPEDNELVLGPFQGKVACTRIPLGKGVCGAAFQQRQSLNVPNVLQFRGHIACDGASRSELVIPIYYQQTCIGVLDIDAPVLDRFSRDDQVFLEECVRILEAHL